MNGPVSTVVLLVCILLSLTVLISSSSGNGHGSGGNSAHIVVPHSTSYKPALTDIQRECELEAINIGTRLADRYNSFDEETDWDVRIHHDYLTKYLGFAGWIQMGLWKNTQLTASRHHAPTIHKSGGWAGHKNITLSAYWPFDNKWVYMMGDSTQRQIWATFVSPFQNNDFERNAKEWTRENCARQHPHRKNHPSDHYFPDEGWGGRCGNNELTCHLSGFGPKGKITFDWKHFPYEDYDEYLFGPEGAWKHTNITEDGKLQTLRFPDILVIHVGLHTCVHALTNGHNKSMIALHESQLRIMMESIHTAIQRPFSTPEGKAVDPKQAKTTVIIQLPGRPSYDNAKTLHCSRKFNRLAAKEAHRIGFTVLEREEIERRLLYKSEYRPDHRTIKPILHLENPAANIVGTSLITLVGCLQRNNTHPPSDDYRIKYRAPDIV